MLFIISTIIVIDFKKVKKKLPFQNKKPFNPERLKGLKILYVL